MPTWPSPGSGTYTVAFGDGASGRRYVAYQSTAITQPVAIELVAPLSSAHTPVDLLAPGNAADWIAITHRAFWDEMLPLTDYRDRIYRVAQVDVQSIYDQFNGGMLSSEAIRDFLEYAHANWQRPAPRFVLLGGGGVSDMRNYLGNSKPTYVPTFIYPADPILGETAADNRFVAFGDADILPDMSIGRFPAYYESEITTMVSKTISYESTPTFNDWNQNILMISDDLEGGGGNFYNFSDTLIYDYAEHDPSIKFLPEPYTGTKAYLGDTCDPVGNPSPASGCQSFIVNEINEGALIVSYVGHALKDKWATESLMNASMVSQMTNSDRLSIFLAMACFEGFFHEPPLNFRSLAERYMIHEGGGAVASWSPTGFGVATGHDWLEQGLFIALFTDGVLQLGEAMKQAKYYMDEHAPPNKYDDLIDTFNLFGDPALTVQGYIAPTAVDMAGMTVAFEDGGVRVNWQTANEVEFLGFNVMRSERPDGGFVKLNGDPILAVGGGSTASNPYSYWDSTAEADRSYWYRLELLNLDDSRSIYGLTKVDPVASHFSIYLPLVTR
ncbi:MAG: hypothetical protein HC802_06230 [Caldilineaceae bacterium]|nr:hypothetical protein [Caldilineaceae bacterium]